MATNQYHWICLVVAVALAGFVGDASGVLVGQWDMDEGTGTTAASQVNSHFYLRS